MNSTLMIVEVVGVLLVTGIILGIIYSRRAKKSQNLHNQFGSEYDHTVQALGSEKKAQKDLVDRQKHVGALDIRPLTTVERDRYLDDWKTVQSKFVDEPGQAISDADHLIMEVMQLRAYPVSDFEQRAADVSVVYPDLVNNYRAAHAIALKNEEKTADTEALRQALIYYRSLFNELLEIQPAVV